MAYFAWQQSYSVGVPSIDEQHKKLVALLNELFESMKAGHGNEVLEKVLNELAQYVGTHFKTEEAMMEKANYPELAEHKAKHQAMTSRVLDLQRQVRDGSAKVTLEVSSFLKGWLQKHILETDMRYKDSMLAAGLK